MVVILSKNVLIFIKFIIQGRFKNQDAEDGQNFSPWIVNGTIDGR